MQLFFHYVKFLPPPWILSQWWSSDIFRIPSNNLARFLAHNLYLSFHTHTVFSALFSLLQWFQEEAIHLFGPVDGVHQPQAARLQAERGALPPAEKGAGPTDHGEIWDQHQPTGERLVTLSVICLPLVLCSCLHFRHLDAYMQSRLKSFLSSFDQNNAVNHSSGYKSALVLLPLICSHEDHPMKWPGYTDFFKLQNQITAQKKIQDGSWRVQSMCSCILL